MSDTMQAIVFGGGIGLVVFLTSTFARHQKKKAQAKRQQEQPTQQGVWPPPPTTRP